MSEKNQCEMELVIDEHGHENDCLLININGGMGADNGFVIKVEVPKGHTIDDMDVEVSHGNGWEAPVIKHEE